MKNIKEYIVNNKKMPAVIAEKTVIKFERNPDIANEFSKWLESGEYETNNPLIVEGYSASDIYKLAPFLDGMGVFNFLISLREQPEKAKLQIESGFPRK